MKKIISIFLFLILLSACARQPAEIPAPDEGAVWQKMAAISSQEDKACRIQFSLRFGEENDTRRVTAILWSNDNETIRMDVMAGVGVTVAKILDAPGHFLMIVPQENKAYIHDGETRPLLRIGTPLPFNLSQLAQLLAGHYTQVYGEGVLAGTASDGAATYELERPAGGLLEISPGGLPQVWKSPNWTLRFKYSDGEVLPSSLRLTGTGSKIAVLLVKKREFPPAPFSNEQMELSAPPGCQILPIADYKPTRNLK